MTKQDTEIEDLRFQVKVFQARAKGEEEPKRYGDDCPGCGEPLVRGEDLRVCHCENEKCKVQKVLA